MWSRTGRGKQSQADEPQVRPPSSSIRVLSGPDELAEALERAIEFEAFGTARYQARIMRYQELGAARPVVVAMTPAPAARPEVGHVTEEHAETA